MPEILMPKLSESMEQGTILSWLKHSGETVEVGDEILEIETDKSTVTYAAEEAGALETLVDEGTTVEVGAKIARINQHEADFKPKSRDHETDKIGGSESLVSAVEPIASGAEVVATEAPNGHSRMSSATPLARRAAAAHGVDIGMIHGTGPLGRVVRADVLRFAGIEAGDEAVRAPSLLPPAVFTPAPATSVSAGSVSRSAGWARREPTRLQQLIARRMVEAKATVPHFQVQTEARMDAVVALRDELRSLSSEEEVLPSLNDFIVRASGIALREHPLANGSFQDDGFILHDRVHIGVAVATEDALVVPTVLDADIKTLRQIAIETRLLAGRVRDGQISPAELEGGTFTISNLGMFGMTAITPVINPPQAAILGVGAIREALARVDGEIVDRAVLTLTLSCDHRILYGADASRFLARIRELLEGPLRLAF